MSTSLTETTIVVPCYNEAERLDVGAFRRATEGDGAKFLLVDDGSTDGTLRILEKLADERPQRIAYLSLPRNQGKAEAVRRGLCRAIEDGARYVGFWDADLATPLDAVAQMVDILAEDDRLEIVLGSRVQLLGRTIERRWQRHMAGRLFATFASWTLGVPVYDTQCGAKLFRVTSRLHEMLDEPFHSRWVFDVELLARYVSTFGSTAEAESRIVEMPLERWEDVAGSKVRGRDFVIAAMDLGRIAWMHRVRSK